MKRREFLGSAAAASTLAFMGNYSWAKPSQPIGVQLYTVRNAMYKDVPGTLKKVAEIGYTHVEGASYDGAKYYGMLPADFKMQLADVGLKMPSAHIGLNFFEKNVEKTIEDAVNVGLEYIVMPWLGPNLRSYEGYKKVIEVLNNANEKANGSGVTLGYHNHDFEFLGDIVPMDMLMNEMDSSIIMELDLYWISRVEKSPVEFFKKYPGRTHLWHVKDMEDSEEKSFAPVGTGTIDFKPVFENTELSGLKYFFVEQDRTKGDPFDAITTSYGNVVKF
ncbi:MAG: sugar phosphate isomerase/epimerase [Saprospiraceae bacterium]|nr:sugar phosphate isomerase/epimerase [Saprospiraceae bacterium]